MGNLFRGLLKEAQSAVIYYQNKRIGEAADSTGNVARTTVLIRANYNYDLYNFDELNMITSEPFLNEFRGNCCMELRDFKSAYFSYMKAAKDYLLEHNNEKKTRKINKFCKNLSWLHKLRNGDKKVKGFYLDLSRKLNKANKLQSDKIQNLKFLKVLEGHFFLIHIADY